MQPKFERFVEAAKADLKGRIKCISALSSYLEDNGYSNWIEGNNKDTYIFTEPENVWNPIDIYLKLNKNGKSYYFDIETKSFNKQYNDYSIIKEEKLNYLLKNNRNNAKLLYVCIENSKHLYIYNIKAIDFSGIKKLDLKQRITQVDETSDLKYYPTYFIPKSFAKHIEIKS